MAEKRVCRDFIENPKKNPIDGGRLIPGKGPYKGYVQMCIENDFDVNYMLDEDFINSLSSNQKRSTSPARSPRNISIPRSPKSSLKSPLRSQPMLPATAFNGERSVSSVIRPDDLPTRSFSDKRLNIMAPQTTQTVYPRVVGPSKTQVIINRTPALNQQSTVQYTSDYRKPIPSYTNNRSVSGVPIPSYVTRSEEVGLETFDPDPVTTVTETPQQAVRRTVAGPYGASGERTVVSGVHKLPGQRTYTTADIPEHEVRSVHNGYNNASIIRQPTSVIRQPTSVVTQSTSVVTQPKRVLYPPPTLNTRSEQIGVETFDPDPITTVTETPQQAIRRTVAGPYGASGERTVISGVHKLPGQRVYTTADIPEHEVRSVNNNRASMVNNNYYTKPMVNDVVTQPRRVLHPPPTLNTRTELIGNETFDPDPVTKVSEIPRQSVRTAVNGPYGQYGENVRTTGLYTSPGRRVYTTADIPEHEVRSSITEDFEEF